MRHGVSNHRQLEISFNNVFQSNIKDNIKAQQYFYV